MVSFIEALKNGVDGEVIETSLQKKVYSVDASIYEIEPSVVVLPRTQEALIEAVRVAHHYSIPVTPRGAATGITGGCLGTGLIIDTTKYLHSIKDIDIKNETVWCEPGVVQNQLNTALAPYGYVLGPDTSTGNRATLGGMIANNSSGAHSIRYGKMVDHVVECRCVLSSGSVLHFQDVDEATWKHKCLQKDEEGEIYTALDVLIEKYRATIKSDFPKIPRRVSGYNLETLLDFPRNLSSLFCGSEGSLGTLIEAKVKICPKPTHCALVVLHFHSFLESLLPIQQLLEYSLYSLEVVDKMVIEMAQQSPSMRGKVSWLEGKPTTFLVAELDASSKEELEGKVAHFMQRIQKAEVAVDYTLLTDSKDMQEVWELRKAGLGLIQSRRSFSRGIGFIEDVAVLPTELHAFMSDFLSLLAKHGKHEVGIYGHAGAGCIHLRPFIDLRSEKDLKIMRKMMEETADLLLRYQGSLSGEHGDGLIRSWLNEKMFGKTLYQAFKDVKKIFDPFDLANPGKVVNAPDLFSNLRLHPQSRLEEIPSFLSFKNEGGLAFAMDMCNGNGQCRKKEGLMCPSFQATKDERHNTRGRAQSLRAIIHGREPLETWTSRELYEILDLCLECKGCKTQCPSQVDIAKLKSEFLYQYQEKHGYSLRSRLFAHLPLWNSLLSMFPKLANRLLSSSFNRFILKKLGVAPQRSLPLLAPYRFSSWVEQQPPTSAQAEPVYLFTDTYTEYHCPEVGQAAYLILKQLGFQVLTTKPQCCKRPMISKGLLKPAKKGLSKLSTSLTSFAEQKIPIIVLEPSCLSVLRDDLVSFFPDKDISSIQLQCKSFEEFLLEQIERLPPIIESSTVHFHVHCHEKALMSSSVMSKIFKKLGQKAQEIPTGCCGMAGSFGYESEHYDVSQKVAALALLPYLKRVSSAEQVLANGFSCRHQIEESTTHKPLHFSQWLAKVLQVSK